MKLPSYSDAALACLAPAQLIDLLVSDEDRVPLELIEACVAHGDAMLAVIRETLDRLDPIDDGADGLWWLSYHAAMIAGRLPSLEAGMFLIDLMHRLEATGDENMMEWLTGYWPVLFSNKPESLAQPLRALAEHHGYDLYTRTNAAETVLSLHAREDANRLEEAIDWLAGIVADEDEQAWFIRLCMCKILLDFPRERHRPLIESLERSQEDVIEYFDQLDIERAYGSGVDRPEWERFQDPWMFYSPAAIEQRQRRWAEEDLWHEARMNAGVKDWPQVQTYVGPQPKVGRNDPCPCGSGKKYKKCCLDRRG